MSYKFNPFTGNLDYFESVSVVDGIATEYRTINNLEALNKKLTLGLTPADANKVSLDIISGTTQEYGIDYNVVSDELIWNALGLDLTLEENDKLRIIYPV